MFSITLIDSRWFFGIEQHSLSRGQMDELSRAMAEDVEQLDIELNAMTDTKLVAAIRFYIFNQHHDGGYHFSPSNYLQNNAYHAPFILYAQLKLSGQNREFKSFSDIARARNWVENFFRKRLDGENKMLETMSRSY